MLPISNVVVPSVLNGISVKGLNYTFTHTSIESISLPPTIETIEGAFCGCRWLKEIYFEGSTPPSFHWSTFEQLDYVPCNALQAIYVPDESVDSYKEALKNVKYKDGHYASEIVQAMP